MRAAEACVHVRVCVRVSSVFVIFLYLQLTSEFAQRVSSKVSELLAVMENGLKAADPRDCTSYTGWAGDDTITHLLFRSDMICPDIRELH